MPIQNQIFFMFGILINNSRKDVNKPVSKKNH